MYTAIHPKLPMTNYENTRNFYIELLGFASLGEHFEQYLMVKKDDIEIHFFAHASLDKKENYGQVYIRTNEVKSLYHSMIEKGISIHPNGHLQAKPWGQMEFSILDPDYNLLTFGQKI